MIKLTFCLRRREGMTREEFHDYWLNTHGPLVRERAEAIGAVRYLQVHTGHEELNKALQAGRGGPEPFDGTAELWFESGEALQAKLATDEGRRASIELLEDEKRFIDLERSPLWFGDEHPVVD
jgi:uncharacterized protein (TIGR02118 family)